MLQATGGRVEMEGIIPFECYTDPKCVHLEMEHL
jgi:hypothetical protein